MLFPLKIGSPKIAVLDCVVVLATVVPPLEAYSDAELMLAANRAGVATISKSSAATTARSLIWSLTVTCIRYLPGSIPRILSFFSSTKRCPEWKYKDRAA